MLSFKAHALWVEIWGFQPGLHANVDQFENTDASRKTFEMGIVPTNGRHQAATRRTVNRILLTKWKLRRAGDGNRTRTISLGICAIRAAVRPDLHCGVSASGRERPLVTGANGTLMARRTAVSPALMAAPWSSPVLLDSCHPLGRGCRVKAREATACGLALTRRTRPRQSSSEEGGTTSLEDRERCRSLSLMA